MGSAPSAVVSGSQQQVYWAGTDGNLWETWYSGNWNGPAEVVTTGYGSMGTAPSAAAFDSQTDVFWWGEGALWESWYTGSWNGPQAIFVDKCEITRQSDNTAYQDGWSRNPGSRVGGIYSSILNYSPWVWPENVGILLNDVFAAVQLSDNHGDDWILGWEELAYGARDTLECFAQPNSNGGYDNECTTETAGTQPVDTFTEYKILYDNQPYSFTYFVNGQLIDTIPTNFDQLTPTASQVTGQILTQSDQIPGGYAAREQFQDTHWYYPNNWYAFNGTPVPSPWFSGNQPVSSTTDTIWDTQCPT